MYVTYISNRGKTSEEENFQQPRKIEIDNFLGLDVEMAIS